MAGTQHRVVLRVRYAMSGTDIGHAGIRRLVGLALRNDCQMRVRCVACSHRPTHALRHVWYSHIVCFPYCWGMSGTDIYLRLPPYRPTRALCDAQD
eukprot:3374373-Rhodomonas_salina.2